MFDQIANHIVYTAVGAIVGGIISWLGARLAQKNDEMKKVKNGLRAQLKNTVRHACKSSLAQGWVELDEKTDILDCYDAYEALVTHNHVMDDLIARYRALPNEPPKLAN